MPNAQARQLARLGRPARYGRGAQTLLDPRVRDTWEIPKSRVKIDQRLWNQTLLPVLERLRGDLGLPPGCVLRAELHSLLVYARGQFFVPHQDSEKADAMVATLVVTLPGAFKGGTLVVEHGGARLSYRGSKTSLSFVAFYADCRHEVRPVTSGHRIVLTYNLLLHGEPPATTQAAPGTVEALARRLDEHFTAQPPAPRGVDRTTASGRPRRLVYLLDHQYTPRGLHWARLKGSDAARAAALRAAAARADCDVVLALADVHETWSCSEPEWEGPWYARPRYGRWDDGDDDDLDAEDAWDADVGASGPEGYELEELVDWSLTLDHWIEPSGGPAEPVSTAVGDDEVCSSTASVDLRPYSSEYEGYMGNYGNTMDRWYHRGALVFWPRQQAFAVRAEASPTWAVAALLTRARADVAGAQAMAATLAPFWSAVASGEQPRALFGKALRLGRALDQAGLAAMLLRPFRLELLARPHASALGALAGCYGEPWTSDLIAVWSAPGRSWPHVGVQGRLEWVASLAALCEALGSAGEAGASAARLLVEDSSRWLAEQVGQRRGLAAPSHRAKALGELARPILAVLASTAVIGAADLSGQAVGHLCAEDDDDVLACLLQVLREARALPAATRAAAGLDLIAGHCAGHLRARLARPPRDHDDWSIELPAGCDCELCGRLEPFLSDSAQRTLDWPLATDGRRHVQSRLDRAELPVRHQTRRTGRPYTLVLTKTEVIFERDQQARRSAEVDLAWLEREWVASASS